MSDINKFNDGAHHHEMYTINNKCSESNFNESVDNDLKVFNPVECVQSCNNIPQEVCECNEVISNEYNHELNHYSHLKTNLLSSLRAQTEPVFETKYTPINISVENQSGPKVFNSEEESIAFTDKTLHNRNQISFKRYRSSNSLGYINEIIHHIGKIQMEIKKIMHSQKKAQTYTFNTMNPKEEEFCPFKNYLSSTDYDCNDSDQNFNKLSNETENKLTNLKADITTMLNYKPFLDIRSLESINKITRNCDSVGSNSSNNFYGFENIYAKTRCQIDDEEEAGKYENVSADVNSSTEQVTLMEEYDNVENNMRNVRKKARIEDRLINSYLEFCDNAWDNAISCKSMKVPTKNDIMFNSALNVDRMKEENMCFSSSAAVTRTTSINASLAYVTVEQLKAMSAKFYELNFLFLKLMESARTKRKNFEQCKNIGNKSNQITLELAQLGMRSFNRRNVSTLNQMSFALHYDEIEDYLNESEHRYNITQESKSFIPVNSSRNALAKSNLLNLEESNINENDYLKEQRPDEILNNKKSRNLNMQMENVQGCVLESEHINENRAITESLLLKNVKYEFAQILEEFMTIKRKLCSNVVDKEETETACVLNEGDARSEHRFTGDKFTNKSFAESLRLETLTVIAKLVKLFGWSLIKMSACELVLAADNESYNNNSILTINLHTGSVTKAEHVANIVRPLEEENVCSNNSSNSSVKQTHFAGNNNNINDKWECIKTRIETIAERMHVVCSAVNQNEKETNASISNAASADEKFIEERSEELEVSRCEKQSFREEHHQENTNDMSNAKGIPVNKALTCISSNTFDSEMYNSTITRELSEIENPWPENILTKDSESVEKFYSHTNVNKENISNTENIKELEEPKEKLEQSNCVSESNSETCREHECITNENKYPFCDASIDYHKNKVIKEACHESVEQKESKCEIVSYETDMHENTLNLESVPDEKKKEENLKEYEEYQCELHTEYLEQEEDLQKESLAKHTECQLTKHELDNSKKEQLAERELYEFESIYLINYFSKENPDNFKFTTALLAENTELENNNDGKGHDKNVRDTSKKLFDENALWEDDGMEDVIAKERSMTLVQHLHTKKEAKDRIL